jgi:hypothetical protein
MPDDQDQLSQHWKELAVQFGLEPGETSQTPTSEKEDEAASPVVIRSEQVAPFQARASAEGPSDQNEETQSSTLESDPVKAPDSDQFVGVTETAGEPAPSSEANRDELQPQRRGRRGRGTEKSGRDRSSHQKRDSGFRGREETRVSSSEDLSQTSGSEVVPESEIPEEPEPAFVEDIPAAENRKEEDESDTDDVDTLSDWNVPSWAELIASLYRPER